MLNQRRNITAVQPPFIMTVPNADWHLIIAIQTAGTHALTLSCVKQEHDQWVEYQQQLDEQPFHVAEDIWELSYGVEIMTLNHSSLANHPATELWRAWKSRP